MWNWVPCVGLHSNHAVARDGTNTTSQNPATLKIVAWPQNCSCRSTGQPDANVRKGVQRATLVAMARQWFQGGDSFEMIPCPDGSTGTWWRA